MPQGQVVGRISVRVLPDTSTFKRDAQRDLERIESQLDVAVQVKPNMTGFLRELLTEVQRINQQNRQSDARKIRIYTRIDTSTMTGELARAIRQYNNRAKTAGKIQLQSQLDAGKVDLKIDPDSLRKMDDQLKDWRDRNSPVKIDIDLNWPTGAATLTSARLGHLTRPRTVPIIPYLESAAVTKVATALAALSGTRVLNRMFERFSNILRNLDTSVPIIGTLAAAIAGLSGWLLTAASNLFSLSASLAQIGPTIGLLPGLLGGFAVGIGVTIAALKDFNKVIPEAKQALHGLQDAISTNFWKQAAEPIRLMVKDLLPAFRRGVETTATQLGGFFGSLAANLSGTLLGPMDQMFLDLAGSINIASTGTVAFAEIIATLGEVGTSYLPRLAQWFVDVSEKFADFLKRKGQNGVKAEIDEGIQALRDLGGVLKNTYGIFSGLARAATEAGGSTLSTLNQKLADIHRTVDSPGFQRGMVDVFRAAHDAMDNLSTTAGPAVKNLFTELGRLLTTVLPKAGAILGVAFDAIASALAQPEVSEGVTAMFDGLMLAVQALAPAMEPLGKAFAALMQLVATMMPTFAALASAALIPLANAFAQLAPMVAPIVALLGGALTQAVQALSPLIERLTPVVGEGLGAAFRGLSDALPKAAAFFQQMAQAVAPLAKAFGDALAPVLPVLASALVQVGKAMAPVIALAYKIVEAVLVPLLPMLSKVVREFLPPLADAIERLMKALEPILAALLAVVKVLMPALVPILQFVITLLGDSLIAAINGVALFLEGLVEIFTGAWDTIVGVLKMAWGLISGIFTGNFDLLSEGWSQFWDGLWTFVKGIWDAILGAFEFFLNIGILSAATKGFKAIGEAFKAGWEAVENFGKASWQSIESGFSSFGSSLAGLGRTAMTRIGSSISSGWTTIKSECSQALSDLKTKIGEWIDDAVKVLKDLPQKAKDGLGDLGQVLVNAGKALIQGFIDGIKSMFDAVKDALGKLTSKLGGWKGPESLDRVLLIPAGQLIIEGFIKGLESRYGAVRKSLAGLTKDVGDTAFEVPGIRQPGMARGLSAAVGSALAPGTGGGITKVLNYYAAPGSSLGSEEDLFAASSRARMGW